MTSYPSHSLLCLLQMALLTTLWQTEPQPASSVCQMGFLSQITTFKTWQCLSQLWCTAVVHPCSFRKTSGGRQLGAEFWCCIRTEHYYQTSVCHMHAWQLNNKDWSWHPSILWARTVNGRKTRSSLAGENKRGRGDWQPPAILGLHKRHDKYLTSPWHMA